MSPAPAYYAHAAAGHRGRARVRRDVDLNGRVRKIHAESQGTYGALRTQVEPAEARHHQAASGSPD
jgi:hypothetical protein